MAKYFIKNAEIINENQNFFGNLVIEDGKISKIIKGETDVEMPEDYEVIDAEDKILIPGIIDTHVHFREPGLTEKATIYTESKAAVAGGVTSYFEMPNTIPQTTTIELLEEKNKLAQKDSFANYSFFIGATNNNFEELEKLNPQKHCGIKLFLGASTGDMLVDREKTIEKIFEKIKLPIVVHSEDTKIISENIKKHKEEYGEKIPIELHGKIRSAEACYKTSKYAVELAKKHNTKLHIAHISTAKELELLSNEKKIKNKKITAEVSTHHLWFCDKDYKRLGTQIKCNPSIKTEQDKNSLLEALKHNQIDSIATDHAPHLLYEKKKNYSKAPSGIPTIQFSLLAILEFYHRHKISLEKIVEKMCHNPAKIFKIEKRGFIREGYFADFVIIDLDTKWIPYRDDVLSKCKWSPFEKEYFRSNVTQTFINGKLVYDERSFKEDFRGQQITFER